jgi:RNA polymerase sigma factor (TIGR02999 family)
MPLVYEELRERAKAYLARERPGHTLQTTALVHEAYLKLVDKRGVRWQNRAHFFGVAAQLMRRILVDYVRARGTVKRGQRAPHISLDDAPEVRRKPQVDLVGLDDVLNRLTEIDPRQGRVVELRFFGGLSIEEAAEVLGLSPATVVRGGESPATAQTPNRQALQAAAEAYARLAELSGVAANRAGVGPDRERLAGEACGWYGKNVAAWERIPNPGRSSFGGFAVRDPDASPQLRGCLTSPPQPGR